MSSSSGRDDKGRFTTGNALALHPFGKGNNAAGKYSADYPSQARRLCLLRRGLTNADLAQYFEVDIRTITNWMHDHPEFAAAVKAGKEGADVDVAEGLYFRASGGSYVEQEVVKVKQVDPATGKLYDDVKIVEVTKYIPPDASAAYRWLANRHRSPTEQWADRYEATPAPQPAEPANVTVNIDKVIVEEREILGGLLENALARTNSTPGPRRDN